MKRWLASLAIVGVILTLSAPPAQALKPDRFQPGPNPDLIVEDVCEFPVLLHDVVNQLVITDFFDRDGNLVRERGTGRIVERITRLDEQGQPVRSITRNISGPGTFTFDEEGASTPRASPSSRTPAESRTSVPCSRNPSTTRRRTPACAAERLSTTGGTREDAPVEVRSGTRRRPKASHLRPRSDASLAGLLELSLS